MIPGTLYEILYDSSRNLDRRNQPTLPSIGLAIGNVVYVRSDWWCANRGWRNDWINMMLLWAILIGSVAGLSRAFFRGRPLTSPKLRQAWLVFSAFIPQLLAFQCTVTRALVPDIWASTALIASQMILMVFAWFNRKLAGFWALGLGLGLNLLVISVNGGFMPISPETVHAIVPSAPIESWQVGQRLGFGKDIVLTTAETRLWFLSDCLVSPEWIRHRIAFSIGDVFIAAGILLSLWATGAEQPIQKDYLEKSV
jgi:hypothetical protein